MRPLFPLARRVAVFLAAILLVVTVPTVTVTRILTFRKGTSFFYRMNYKVNVIPSTTIFAQAAGFKVVWEVPASRAGGQRVGRSVPDIHRGAELLYESHGFDGRACMLKTGCRILRHVDRKDGVVAKILKLLVGSYVNNDTSCATEETARCPLEFLGIDSYHDEATPTE